MHNVQNCDSFSNKQSSQAYIYRNFYIFMAGNRKFPRWTNCRDTNSPPQRPEMNYLNVRTKWTVYWRHCKPFLLYCFLAIYFCPKKPGLMFLRTVNTYSRLWNPCATSAHSVLTQSLMMVWILLLRYLFPVRLQFAHFTLSNQRISYAEECRTWRKIKI
jgi:hypothetical protein